MRRRRLEIFYVGRGRAMFRDIADILAAAGYQVSPRRPGPRAPREQSGIRLVVAEGLSAAEFQRWLADAALGPGRGRVTVASAEATPPPETFRRGGARRRRPEGRQVSMTLRALRESAGRTQREVARRVSMTQPQLSRVEARRDHLISTLRRYVEALDGNIEIVAVVGGARVVLQHV
jgi:hypothetical protein